MGKTNRLYFEKKEFEDLLASLNTVLKESTSSKPGKPSDSKLADSISKWYSERGTDGLVFEKHIIQQFRTRLKKADRGFNKGTKHSLILAFLGEQPPTPIYLRTKIRQYFYPDAIALVSFRLSSTAPHNNEVVVSKFMVLRTDNNSYKLIGEHHSEIGLLQYSGSVIHNDKGQVQINYFDKDKLQITSILAYISRFSKGVMVPALYIKNNSQNHFFAGKRLIKVIDSKDYHLQSTGRFKLNEFLVSFEKGIVNRLADSSNLIRISSIHEEDYKFKNFERRFEQTRKVFERLNGIYRSFNFIVNYPKVCVSVWSFEFNPSLGKIFAIRDNGSGTNQVGEVKIVDGKFLYINLHEDPNNSYPIIEFDRKPRPFYGHWDLYSLKKIDFQEFLGLSDFKGSTHAFKEYLFRAKNIKEISPAHYSFNEIIKNKFLTEKEKELLQQQIHGHANDIILGQYEEDTEERVLIGSFAGYSHLNNLGVFRMELNIHQDKDQFTGNINIGNGKIACKVEKINNGLSKESIYSLTFSSVESDSSFSYHISFSTYPLLERTELFFGSFSGFSREANSKVPIAGRIIFLNISEYDAESRITLCGPINKANPDFRFIDSRIIRYFSHKEKTILSSRELFKNDGKRIKDLDDLEELLNLWEENHFSTFYAASCWFSKMMFEAPTINEKQYYQRKLNASLKSCLEYQTNQPTSVFTEDIYLARALEIPEIKITFEENVKGNS